MMTTIIKLNGEVINIGEWDYQHQPVKADTSKLTIKEVSAIVRLGRNPQLVYDEAGEIITEATNPLPEGAVVEESEVVELPDGGRCVAGDHTKLRKYPPIEEQLDYIYHNGIDAWKSDMIAPVKARYPRS